MLFHWLLPFFLIHPDLPSDLSSKDSLTVYVFLEDECLISQFYMPALNKLNKEYKDRHVGFIGYFPSPTTGADEIAVFTNNYKVAFPMFQDPEQSKTRELGVRVTPEVAVWDHRHDQLIYRGRIDDSYVRVGKRKLNPQNHDLEDIISSWLLNQVLIPWSKRRL